MRDPDPERQGNTSAVIRCLCIGVALMCAGVAWYDLSYEASHLEYLYTNSTYRLDFATADTIVRYGSYLLLVCIPFLFLQRTWPAALFVSVWMGFRTFASWQGEVWHPYLVPLENVVRYAGPLVLVGLFAFQNESSDPSDRMSWIEPMLQILASLTFAGHGLAAYFHQPEFIDFILDAGTDLFHLGLSQTTAEHLLTGIGLLDLAVALLILLPYRLRWVAGWMVFWGILTAFARITRYGWEQAPLTLMRALNGLVPLSLLLYWWPRTIKSPDSATDSP